MNGHSPHQACQSSLHLLPTSANISPEEEHSTPVIHIRNKNLSNDTFDTLAPLTKQRRAVLPDEATESHRYKCAKCSLPVRYWFTSQGIICGKEVCECHPNRHGTNQPLTQAEKQKINCMLLANSIMQVCRCTTPCLVPQPKRNWYTFQHFWPYSDTGILLISV